MILLSYPWQETYRMYIYASVQCSYQIWSVKCWIQLVILLLGPKTSCQAGGASRGLTFLCIRGLKCNKALTDIINFKHVLKLLLFLESIETFTLTLCWIRLLVRCQLLAEMINWNPFCLVSLASSWERRTVHVIKKKKIKKEKNRILEWCAYHSGLFLWFGFWFW